jgi:hypothetical protein
MAYSSTSKFVQLTPFLLMEYMYADQPNPESYFTNSGSDTVGFNKMVNGYMSDSVQIFNPNDDYYITQNGANDSVVKIDESSFVTLDSNLIIPFNDYSDYLTNTIDLPVVFPYNLNVVYDSVRYHIRAGYNLNNIDGIILGIEFQDYDSSYVTMSQILLKKGTEQEYTLNPNPVTIGANIYDKYFEIKIPSLKSMNDTYLATPSNFQSSSLAGLLSKSGKGFIYGSPMRVSVWQVQSTQDYSGYSKYNSARIALLSLEQEDPFSNIGATIQESDQGQFFEYFATDNEGFIEDFVLFQNSIGNSYYINHQIEVLEQIGAAIIETSRFENNQTTAYDSPNYYRPILRNAAYASTFFLRYTMSLINSKDQSRIVRISTYSSNDPNKWGLTITPIQLSNFPQVQKIYNRVYSQPQISFNSSLYTQPKEIVKFSNVFIEQHYVSATVENLTFSNNSLTQRTVDYKTIALGIGKLIITLSPFDNYFKFSFVKNGPDGNPVSINFSDTGIYSLAFLDDQGNKVYCPLVTDNNIANPSKGELAFLVDESTVGKILQFIDRRFFVVNGYDPQKSTNPGATGNVSVASIGSSNRISTVIKGDNGLLTMSQPSSNTNTSTTMVYWGYWKKEGEVDNIGATGGNFFEVPISIRESAALSSTTENLNNLEVAPASSIIQQIKPQVGGTTGKPIVGGDTGKPQIGNTGLSGDALISALRSQIQGYHDSGWTDVRIKNYFLNPGFPGYTQYPGLTLEQFLEAAKEIISRRYYNSLEDTIKSKRFNR